MASSEVSREAGQRHPWRGFLALGGSLAILAYGVYRLPDGWWRLHLPHTPIDNSRIHESATEYRLLVEADRLVPTDATVLVRSAAGSIEKDVYLHRFAVALLPGRHVLPAIANGQPQSDALRARADYLVIVGPGVGLRHGELLLTTDDGTVWQMNRP